MRIKQTALGMMIPAMMGQAMGQSINQQVPVKEPDLLKSVYDIPMARKYLPKDLQIGLVNHRSPEVSKDAKAYAVKGDKRIYIMTDTPAWKLFMENPRNMDNLMSYAGILAHEGYHVENPNDEEGAYNHQVKVLQALGATEREITNALLARDATRMKKVKR
jgi:hypothetical protein